MRYGVGTCTYADQSTYSGDWVNNVRHGNGFFQTGGDEPIKYYGEWVNDVKHGHGKLIYNNGEEIIGLW